MDGDLKSGRLCLATFLGFSGKFYVLAHHTYSGTSVSMQLLHPWIQPTTDKKYSEKKKTASVLNMYRLFSCHYALNNAV
jgi:hypothetical protein